MDKGEMIAVDFSRYDITNGVEFTEFREDGWPLCPMCGQDELYRFELTVFRVRLLCLACLSEFGLQIRQQHHQQTHADRRKHDDNT